MPIDYSKYPPNWKKEIVPRILERAGHQCEKCGLANYQEVWSIPLRVCEEGKYKIRRFWITSEGDYIRMKPFSLGGDIKKVRVVLTIAHLDHDETNHDVEDERLKAWCQSCHLNYDAKEKMRRIMLKGAAEESQLALIGANSLAP